MTDRPRRKRLNIDEKRVFKEADVSRFLHQYKRKAQRGREPNDRYFDNRVRKLFKRMSAEELDDLINDAF